ncbi:D-arabinono-1,4-lactone oxidase [Sanguibacter sp. A247]|uniref:D-arabinono-1,4-lactone oxidase n=1 Tax=unclassified Sanguibacter TaxID=2645534 RepID=UPI003FD6F05F
MATFPFTPSHAPGPSGLWRNWSGSVASRPHSFVEAIDADDVAMRVGHAVAADRPVRVVGAGHSFSPLVATNGTLLSLDRLAFVDEPVALAVPDGRATHTVRVGAGLRLRHLNAALARLGLAMSNLGDIDHQSVAGAISTGTHGTGGAVASLSAQVRAVELVLADGSRVSASPTARPELFEAARLGLGTLGVLTAVTLAVEPAYVLEAREEPWPLDRVLDQLDDLLDLNDHVEFFWFPHTRRALLKRNNRRAHSDAPLGRARAFVDDEVFSNGLFEVVNRVGHVAPRAIPRLNALSSRALSARRFTAPSHDVFVSPRRVRFRESEWAVPLDVLPTVLSEIEAWIAGSGEHVSFPVEVRFAAPDDVWLSTAYGRDTAYVAVHQYWRTDPTRLFTAVQQIMLAHEGRPHWGKEHRVGLDHLEAVYPRLGDFRAARAAADPSGMFLNAHLRRMFEL